MLAFRSAIIYESVAIPIPTDPALPSAGLPAVDRAWRIVVGFGCIPALISLYYRLTIPETPRYTIDIERDIAQGQSDVEGFLANEKPHGKDDSVPHEHQYVTPKASRRDFIRHFGQWKYGKVLLGTAGSWFMLDIAFYGLGLNNSVILQAIGYASKGTTYEILHNIAVGNLIIQCAGTLPGYWFAIGFIDIMGRKPMQIGSFAILTGLFVTIGFAYWPLYAQESKAGFITLFVMCQFFMNFGANTTTFIVPGEVFPTRYRTTAHGISAACGKLGAVIAQVVFSPLKDKGGVTNGWVNHLMQIFALFMLIGFCLSWLIPETNGKTLEELCGENDEDELRQQAENNQREREEEEGRRADRRARVDAMSPPVAKTTSIDKVSL
jgi:MFS transporter, PHS family, inorganic phosphate transporter